MIAVERIPIGVGRQYTAVEALTYANARPGVNV
jgi:hypothetical protein